MAARPLTVREKRLTTSLELAKSDLSNLLVDLASANRQIERLQLYRAMVKQSEERVTHITQQRLAAEEKIAKLRAEKKAVQDQLRRAKAPRKLSAAREALCKIAVGFGEARVLPEPLVGTTVEIINDPSMGDVLEQLTERRDVFGSDQEMLLAGIGMSPQARRHFDRALDRYWDRIPAGRSSDVAHVVGSGVHAAIFSAVKHRSTNEKPVVLERGRAGGSFAMTEGPSFYLNSRNRPGNLSIPGDEFGALNVLPGAPLQPSQLSGSEYIANDVMAFCVRLALLMHAEVYTGIDVTKVRPLNAAAVIDCVATAKKRASIRYIARNVAFATGLGSPRKAFPSITSDRYLNYVQFMKRMDSPYPLRGMERVAVIGDGDGGKTVIEALTGQGPATPLSVVSMDYPKVIDWFGVSADRRTRETWEACNRSRYKGIGRLLPRENGGSCRVQPYDRPSFIDVGYASLRVNGMPYDFVIDATGYTENLSDVTGYLIEDIATSRDPNTSAALCRSFNPYTYAIGPASMLEQERMEPTILNGIRENATSIFRYADKTARLAELL